MGKKNDFKSEFSKKYSRFKLWVAYKPSSEFFSLIGATYNYRSYHCAGNEKKSLQKLIDLFEKRKDHIERASIFDFKTGNIIHKLK